MTESGLPVLNKNGFFKDRKDVDHSKHFKFHPKFSTGNRGGFLTFGTASARFGMRLVFSWKGRKEYLKSLTMKLSILLLSMFHIGSVRIWADFWISDVINFYGLFYGFLKQI